MAMNGNEGGSAYPPNPDVKSGPCLIAGFQPLTAAANILMEGMRILSNTEGTAGHAGTGAAVAA